MKGDLPVLVFSFVLVLGPFSVQCVVMDRAPTVALSPGEVKSVHIPSGVLFLPLNQVVLSSSSWTLLFEIDIFAVCQPVSQLLDLALSNSTTSKGLALRRHLTIESLQVAKSACHSLALLAFSQQPTLPSFDGQPAFPTIPVQPPQDRPDSVSSVAPSSTTTTPPTVPRVKRGLLDIGGKLFHQLFGVATDDELDDLQSSLEFLRTSVKNLSHVEERQLSLLRTEDATLDLLGSAVDNITQQEESFQRTLQALNSTAHAEYRFLLQQVALTRSASTFQAMAHTACDAVSRLEHAVTQAADHLLHPSLLSPSQLTSALRAVSAQLPQSLRLFLPPEAAHLYFSEHFLSTFASSKGFLFLLRLPLFHETDSFQLYSIRHLPYNHPNSSIRSYSYASAEFFGTNADQTLFVELSHQDLLSCTTGPLKLCPLMSGIRSRSTPSCLSALFWNEQQATFQLCPKKITTNPAPIVQRHPSISQVWSFSLASSLQMYLTCQNQPPAQTQLPAGQVMINIPSGCSVHTAQFQLPVHLTGQTTAATLGNFSHLPDVTPGLPESFSSDELAYLFPSAPPVAVNNSVASPTPTHKQALLHHYLSRYANRTVDFDALQAELQSTDRNIFQSPAHFVHHTSGSGLWFTVGLTLCLGYGLLFLCYLVRRRRKHLVFRLGWLYGRPRRNSSQQQDLSLQPLSQPDPDTSPLSHSQPTPSAPPPAAEEAPQPSPRNAFL